MLHFIEVIVPIIVAFLATCFAKPSIFNSGMRKIRIAKESKELYNNLYCHNYEK